jgi:hypothetical protein
VPQKALREASANVNKSHFTSLERSASEKRKERVRIDLCGRWYRRKWKEKWLGWIVG